MSVLTEVVTLHMATQEGYTAKLPSLILKAWYFMRINVFNDCCLIVHKVAGHVQAFVLYDLNRHEIVFISVAASLQGQGIGTKLIKSIKQRPLLVKYSKNNILVCEFYRKLGFKPVFFDGDGHIWSELKTFKR